MKPARTARPVRTARTARTSPALTAGRSRALRAAATLFLAILAGVAMAGPAQAAAYRYWGYFHLEKGAWAFAQTGPAEAVPKDGAVEGWRFAVADETSIRDPRATPTFDALCAGVKAATGSKRVGLVLDYGRPADSPDGTQPPAPRATCVAVPAKATGSDVLVAADAKLRQEGALTCGIDGWPAAGCGPVVDPVPAAAASPDTDITIAAPKAAASATPATAEKKDEGSSLPLLGGLAAFIAVGGLGFMAWRRSRDTTTD